MNILIRFLVGDHLRNELYLRFHQLPPLPVRCWGRSGTVLGCASIEEGVADFIS